MDCTIRLAKTKALISFAVTAKLICAFVFAYAEILFSHDAAHSIKTVGSMGVTAKSCFGWGARWLSGRASASVAKGREF